MTQSTRPNAGDQSAGEDLVLVRASDLAALRALVDAVENSSDGAGCDPSRTVIEAAPLTALVEGMKAVKEVPLRDVERNAGRYLKLRGWMSSNVPEGWREVENMGAVASWQSWEDMDGYLDALPQCRVGLMANCPDGADGPSAAAAQGATVPVVIQEGGSTGELYLHAFDDEAQAQAYRYKARDEGSYRTSPVMAVARALVAPGVLAAAESLMRTAATELAYPQGPSPEDSENVGERRRGERNVE